MDMSEKKAGVSKIKRYGIPLLIIILGLLLSLTIFILARDWDLQRIRTQFNREADDYYETLKREIDSDLQTLLSLQTFYFYSHKVERSDFKDFVKPILSRHPGIQALEWIPRIPNSQRETYEKAARQDGFPGFQLTDREAQGKMVKSPHREEYFPVYFVEPYKGNEAALGFNLASDQKRREVLERSCDTGEMVASGRIRLVQETAGQFGFLVFAPIYRKGAPADSVESRRQNLEGFTLGVFRIGDIMEKSLSYLIPRGIDVSLYDESAPMEERFLYLHRSRLSAVATTSETDKGAKSETRIQYAKGIDVAGRKWMFLCTPFPGYIASRRSWQPWEVLFGGLLLTVLLGSYMVINVNRTERIERLVKERTVELRKINEKLEQEITARTRAEEELQKAHDELEDRVKERTQELSVANEQLQCEITERKRTEEVIQSLARFPSENPNPVLRIERDGTLLYANEASYTLLRDWQLDIGRPAPLVLQQVASETLTRQIGKTIDIEHGQRTISFSVTPVVNTGYANFYGRDITERKRGEEALRQAEESYRSIFENAVEGIFQSTPEGRYISANPAQARMLGYESPEELITSITDIGQQVFVESERRQEFNRLLEEHGVVKGFEFQANRKDGSRIWISSNVRAIRDATGTVIHYEGTAEDITERKQVEEKLSETRQVLVNIALGITDGILVVTKDFKIIWANEVSLRMAGCKMEELVGNYCYKTTHHSESPCQPPHDICPVREVINTGNPATVTHTHFDKEGNELFVEVSAYPVKDEKGEIIQFVHLCRDITERKRAEEMLGASEERYRTLFEGAAEGILVADIESKQFKYVNPATCRMLGYTAEELTRLSLADIHPKEALDHVVAEFEAQARGEKTLSPEIPCLRKDGSVIYTNVLTAPVVIDGRKCNVGFFTDITERRLAEEALRESEKRFKLAAESSTDLIYEWDIKERVDWFGKIDELLGYSPSEFPRTIEAWANSVHPEDRDRVMAAVKNHLENNEPYNIEYRVRKKDGTYNYWWVRGNAVRDEKGNPYRWVGAITDVTERKRAEEALRESEKLYRTLIETSPDAILLADTNTNFIMVNQMAVRLYGYQNVGEMIGKTFLDHIPPEERPRLFEHFKKTLQTGNSQAMEHTALKKDGSSFPAEVNASLLVDTQGRPKGTIAIVRDITERKHTTTELVNLNKQLEAAREAAEAGSHAKGEFLASMSHEIRTPLNAVIGMLGLLSTSELNGPHREYVEIARSSADSLLVIINDILDFSKIEAGKLLFEPVSFDLLRVVEETIDMMVMKTREKGLDLTVQYRPDVPRHFIGDSGRIRQVLINLVNNAIKFTHKGHVLIDVRAEEPMNEEVLLRITVEDTGIGISSDKLDSLFKPFVQADASTTRRYGGTGLGLAISKRLVEMMGGTIGASSRSGEGSAFWYTLRLPLDKEFTGVPLPLTDLSGVRVLIADSYEVDRRVLQEHLVSWGIGNDSCVSGEEVLTMLREAYAKGEPYQVALIDYQMPDIPGETLGRAIKADRVLRETVLIMLTSWKQRGHCDCIREAGFASCLSKPIRPSQLLEVLTVAWETWNQGVVHKRTVPHIRAEFLATQTALPKTARWGRPLRVLVVEDNVVNQRVTMLMLTEFGCHVDLAANGREAVEMVELLPFDMVFMDCEMPEMDGFEATGEIRRLQGDKHLPIIAMTAYALQGDRERCLAAGMDDYLSKPVKLEDFQAALERWGPKDSRSFEGRLKPPASLEKAPLTVENETSGVIDPNVIARLRVLADATDPSLLTRIFHLFLSDTPERITSLREAAATGDTAGLSKAAHSLRGACVSIGVMGMAEICKTLESLGHGKYVDGAMALVEKLETEFNQVKVEIEREIADDRLALLSTAGKKDENI